jgi:non-canonical purine NTP pyrophosphatase (RdgB/HAM1 family)
MEFNSDIVVVGAGPSTLAFCSRITKINPELNILILESGKSFTERLESPTQENLICGWGGAAFYSDRKFSGPPCGTGLRHTNIMELRDSYTKVVEELIQATSNKDTKTQFEKLRDDISQFLGDDNTPVEIIQKKFAQYTNHTGLKPYPSVVLNDVDEAQQIVNHYHQFVNNDKSKITIVYDSKVNCIKNVGQKQAIQFTTYGKETVVFTDYIILAMGRFGGLQMKSLGFESKYLKSGRIEFGVRLELDSLPDVLSKIRQLQNKTTSNGIECPDLKYEYDTELTIEGAQIKIQLRTFCVCLPKTGSGLMACSSDITTKITTFSGSSSVDELEKRGDLPYVIKGSNMGIMIRVNGSQPSSKLKEDIYKMCRNFSSEPMKLDLENVNSSLDELSTIYPKDITYIIYHGISTMLNNICGKPLTGKVNVYGPCLEGTGIYPKVNESTYQMEDTNIFVMGDMVGHTRGLLQSMVMGDIVAKYINLYIEENKLHSEGYLKTYQSLYLPICAYGYVNNQITYNNCIFNHKNIQTALNTLSQDKQFITLIDKRTIEIMKDMHIVHHGPAMTSLNLGVIYELHNFFVDTTLYPILHHITAESMTQYIFLCNLIDTHFKSSDMIKFMTDQLKNTHPELYDKYGSKVTKQLSNTCKNHDLKSCILSLRTRESIETRDDYTDIQVMQSAYKFLPVTKEFYQDASDRDITDIKNMELYLVATLMAWIDIAVAQIINKCKLTLNMVRTKIETQEPAIVSFLKNTNPLYLECHVKVKMTTVDGKLLDYHTKSRIIQIIAEAFEGPNAIEPDIFNILSVSINLLKHPDNHQQYFLTFRTHTKTEMELIRRKFNQIMQRILKYDMRLQKYALKFITDAEFVIYDNFRPFDLGWFPSETDFLVDGFKNQIEMVTWCPKHVIFLSANSNKVEEYRQLIIKLYPKDQFALIRNKRVISQLTESTEYDIVKAGNDKAIKGYKLTNYPVLVETTGLCILRMNNFPGNQTKTILKQMGILNFAKIFKDKNVVMKTALHYCDQSGVHTVAVKETPGTIVLPRGEGWEWDTIFEPTFATGNPTTFAELSLEQKNSISTRKLIIQEFVAFQNGILKQ